MFRSSGTPSGHPAPSLHKRHCDDIVRLRVAVPICRCAARSPPNLRRRSTAHWDDRSFAILSPRPITRRRTCYAPKGIGLEAARSVNRSCVVARPSRKGHCPTVRTTPIRDHYVTVTIMSRIGARCPATLRSSCPVRYEPWSSLKGLGICLRRDLRIVRRSLDWIGVPEFRVPVGLSVCLHLLEVKLARLECRSRLRALSLNWDGSGVLLAALVIGAALAAAAWVCKILLDLVG